MKHLTGIALLVLAVCVLVTAVPDYREMDRKDEYFRGCMTKESNQQILVRIAATEFKNRDAEEWEILGMCHVLWNAG